MLPLPPWPCVHVDCADESAALAALAQIESILGPCPQAELLEPWEPDEPHRLRVECPELTPEQARAIVAALPTVRVEAGLLPGVREARDQDRVVPDVLERGEGRATLWSDSVEGGLVLPDVAEEPADPEAAAVASELVEAVRGVGAELVPDAGAAVRFVRERGTGRRGWRLEIPGKPLEPLDGDALNTLRLDLVAALGQVVERRAQSELPLSAQFDWDPRLGLAFVVWRQGGVGPSLPGDGVVPAGVSPPLEVLASLDLAQRVAELELQVVPQNAAAHDGLVEAVVSLIEGSAIAGGGARWLACRDGVSSRWVFCPTWTVAVEALGTCAELLHQIAALPLTFAVRIVPGIPTGLEYEAPFVDPAVQWGGARYFVRWRDGCSRRDRLVAWVSRPSTPADAPLVAALHAALARVPSAPPVPSEGQWIRPIVDVTGRHGLSVHWEPDLAWDALRLAWVLGALGGAVLPGLCDVVDWALPADGVVVQFWFRDRPDEATGEVTWVSVG